MLFSGNIIEEENDALENFNPGSNQIIGKSISMNSNWLMPASNDDTAGKKLLAWAMAESAFYAGNSGPEESRSATSPGQAAKRATPSR